MAMALRHFPSASATGCFLHSAEQLLPSTSPDLIPQHRDARWEMHLPAFQISLIYLHHQHKTLRNLLTYGVCALA